MNDDEERDANVGNALYHAGAALLNWGRFETRVTYNIIRLAPGATGPRVNPKNLMRTLTALMNKWHTAFCDKTADRIKEASELRDQVVDLAIDRNTICHGFGGVVVSPVDYEIVCWKQYHQFRMLGDNPEQTSFSKEDLAAHCQPVASFERDLDHLTEPALAWPRNERIRNIAPAPISP